MSFAGRQRCPWPGEDPLNTRYHDEEWGVPLYDERRQFEMLILEGMQAGLSWITVLRKREAFRSAFDGFDPSIIARYGDEKIESLLNDPGIIRNRQKILAAIGNARAWLALKASGIDPVPWLWSFVGGSPVQNAWTEMSDVPAKTEEAEALSKALSKRGFRFVGPTICYAHMQATGMVNDHLVRCRRWQEIGSPRR